MLRPSAFFGVLLFASAGTIAACGGSVVFVEDGGEGGNGGSGPTTSSSPTTTKTTTKATTTTTMSSVAPSTTTGMLTPCQIFCSAPAGQCFGPDECPQICADVYWPGCEAEADALILCYAQYLTSDCSIGTQCSQQEVAYSNCTSQPADCQDFECSVGGDWCDCYGQCFGSNLEQYCYATPTQVQCDCYGDFGMLGSCTQPNISCSLDTGCCKQFFFDG